MRDTATGVLWGACVANFQQDEDALHLSFAIEYWIANLGPACFSSDASSLISSEFAIHPWIFRIVRH